MYENIVTIVTDINKITEPLVPLIQVLGLVFLIIYVVKTWQMASATREAAKSTEKSVDEMKEMRDQETAPYIVAYFDLTTESGVIYLVVKNIGHSVAERVRLTITPPLKASVNVSEISFIKDGIKSMPPEYEIRTLVDGVSSYFGNPDLPREYRVKVSYFGGLQTNERIYEQTLDLSTHEDLFYLPQKKNIGHLVHEVKQINQKLQDIKKPIDNIANIIGSGIFINNPSLYVTDISSEMLNWSGSLLSKLREFENIWLIADDDVRLEIPNPNKLQVYVRYLSKQLLILLANRPSDTPDELIDCISDLCKSLEQLAQMRFFFDGGASANTLNVLDKQIIEDLNNAVDLIKTSLQPTRASDDANRSSSSSSE